MSLDPDEIKQLKSHVKDVKDKKGKTNQYDLDLPSNERLFEEYESCIVSSAGWKGEDRIHIVETDSEETEPICNSTVYGHRTWLEKEIVVLQTNNVTWCKKCRHKWARNNGDV